MPRPHAVTLDPTDPTGQTVLLTPATPLADGVYTVVVHGSAISLQGLQVDGTGTGVPGGDKVATVVFDRVAPQVLSIGLDSNSDTGIQGDNLTSNVLPVIDVNASDVFPAGSTGTLTVALNGDGTGFNDGQTTITLSGSGVPTVIPVQLLRPLATGANTISVQVTDASGNVTTMVDPNQIVINRTGASLLTSTEQTTSQGLVFTMTFSEDLDPTAVTNMANIQLLESSTNNFASGNLTDRTASILPGNIVYTDANPVTGTPATLTVTASLLTNGTDDNFYQLTILAANLVDRAGNLPLAGDVNLQADYDTVGPAVQGIVVTAPIGALLPDTIAVDFGSKDINVTTADNPANYQLDLIGPNNQLTPVALATPVYTQSAHRTLLHLAGSTDTQFGRFPRDSTS